MNILCILLFINLVKSLHLNNYQINLINNLIQNPLLQNKEREKVNLILYKAYEKWAIKKAIDFKTLHKYKCANIKTQELVLSSKMGLFKSIKKYNGKFNFINYSSIYVNSELLKTITETYSLSILPKSFRRKSKANISIEDSIKYNNFLNTELSCQYKKWKLDLMFVSDEDVLGKIIKKNEEEEKIKKITENLSSFSKRVLYLKYNYNDNLILSNKSVSELMCCSEETVRKSLEKIKQKANI
jgi:DNA-directed RNA polymerase sigma subunit (sigma70/sigma32)